jgi:hypothetical protein
LITWPLLIIISHTLLTFITAIFAIFFRYDYCRFHYYAASLYWLSPLPCHYFHYILRWLTLYYWYSIHS